MSTATTTVTSTGTRLSTAAIVGIAVGGFILLDVVIAFVIFLSLRRRRLPHFQMQQRVLRSQDSLLSEMEQLFFPLPSQAPSRSSSQHQEPEFQAQEQRFQARANNHLRSSMKQESASPSPPTPKAQEFELRTGSETERRKRRSRNEHEPQSNPQSYTPPPPPPPPTPTTSPHPAPLSTTNTHQQVPIARVIITPPTPISPQVFRVPSLASSDLLAITENEDGIEKADGNGDGGSGGLSESESGNGNGRRANRGRNTPERDLLLKSKREGMGLSFRERVEAGRERRLNGVRTVEGAENAESVERVRRLMNGNVRRQAGEGDEGEAEVVRSRIAVVRERGLKGRAEELRRRAESLDKDEEKRMAGPG